MSDKKSTTPTRWPEGAPASDNITVYVKDGNRRHCALPQTNFAITGENDNPHHHGRWHKNQSSSSKTGVERRRERVAASNPRSPKVTSIPRDAAVYDTVAALLANGRATQQWRCPPTTNTGTYGTATLHTTRHQCGELCAQQSRPPIRRIPKCRHGPTRWPNGATRERQTSPL
jgi:hypothetical protein